MTSTVFSFCKTVDVTFSAFWQFLAARVPEDTLSDVSLVLTIAPAEMRESFANFEFERPVPSQL